MMTKEEIIEKADRVKRMCDLLTIESKELKAKTSIIDMLANSLKNLQWNDELEEALELLENQSLKTIQ